jgi:hypothetical protein
MNDFVQETIEKEKPPRMIGCFTGWESIVFEVEDEPEPERHAEPRRRRSISKCESCAI